MKMTKKYLIIFAFMMMFGFVAVGTTHAQSQQLVWHFRCISSGVEGGPYNTRTEAINAANSICSGTSDIYVYASSVPTVSLRCDHLGHKVYCELENASGVQSSDWSFAGFSPNYFTRGGNAIEFPAPSCSGYYTVNVSWQGNFYYQHNYDWDGWYLFC